MSHTPGPWHLDRGMPDDPYLDVCDVGGYAFVRVYEQHPRLGYAWPLDANARLIAAAPDLLAALERIVGAVDRAGRALAELADDLVFPDLLRHRSQSGTARGAPVFHAARYHIGSPAEPGALTRRAGFSPRFRARP